MWAEINCRYSEIIGDSLGDLYLGLVHSLFETRKAFGHDSYGDDYRKIWCSDPSALRYTCSPGGTLVKVPEYALFHILDGELHLARLKIEYSWIGEWTYSKNEKLAFLLEPENAKRFIEEKSDYIRSRSDFTSLTPYTIKSPSQIDEFLASKYSFGEKINLD